MSFPNRGDLFWVNLDPAIGVEIKKTRPAVIISPDAANRSGPLVIVAPVTKAGGKKIHFHEVFIPKGDTGLRDDSKVKVFRLRCIDKKRLIWPKIGSVTPETMEDINKKLLIVTGLY